MNEKPESRDSFGAFGTERPMEPQVIHYYIGMSGRNRLSKCGLKIDKQDPSAGWIRLDVDIFDTMDNPSRMSERKKTMCPTCAEYGALVSLGNTEL